MPLDDMSGKAARGAGLICVMKVSGLFDTGKALTYVEVCPVMRMTFTYMDGCSLGGHRVAG